MGNGTGIASFILGIIVSFLHFGIVLPLLLTALSTNTFEAAMRVLVIGILVLIIALVGLILGIVGITSDERKVFAIIGLILCVHPFIFIILLIFIVQASTEP